jgi:hypothetical protein
LTVFGTRIGIIIRDHAWAREGEMRGNVAGADARALRLASEFRRRVTKRAAELKKQSPETERARCAVLAVSRRLQEVIATLETRRGL